ncbi:aminodeoxychorismate lyase [Aliikangiella maris]|uniref:Aminodeoxychorismate lyase n=2 Tax=Aliikangiella maris TaxID=3162458 RepID=A0ABV3ML84_9GAMM
MNIKLINQITKPKENFIFDRGRLFGDGFFTTGLIDSGELRHQVEHFERLKLSAEKLGFSDLDFDEIAKFLKKAIRKVAKAVIRISVTRGQTQRGYAIGADQSSNIEIIISPWIDKPSIFCEVFVANTPVSINAYLAGLKHLNRLDSVLAASECKQSNQEALLTFDNRVICGSRSNLFIFQDGCWKTPRLNDAGVSGITRKRILALMAEKQIPCEVEKISLEQLESCQSAFITNCLVGIWPVAKINDKAIATKLSCDLQADLNFIR